MEREAPTAAPRVIAQDVAGVNASLACAALIPIAAVHRGMRHVSMNALKIAEDAVGMVRVAAPVAHRMDAVPLMALAATVAHAKAACVIRTPTAARPSGIASASACAPMIAVPVSGVQAAAVEEEMTPLALETATA